MSSETEPIKKRRSGAWYLLPIFLTIFGGVIAYFVIKDDDPKKAKNCLCLGIILIAIWIGFSVISGMMLASEMENSPVFDEAMGNFDEMEVETSDNLTPEELGILHEYEMNQIFESMPYDHEVFGLEIGYLQLQNEQGIAVTEFNKDEIYSVVAEITNADDFEKNIHYTVGMFNWRIGYEEFTSNQITLPAFGTVTVSHDNMAITIPENYEIGLELVDVDRVDQLLEEFNAADLPSWRPYSEILYLTESQ